MITLFSSDDQTEKTMLRINIIPEKDYVLVENEENGKGYTGKGISTFMFCDPRISQYIRLLVTVAIEMGVRNIQILYKEEERRKLSPPYFTWRNDGKPYNTEEI
jgi:hypothetical protein